MRVTCVLNLKGGVGKTTTVNYMAAILARDHGKKVLLIDCDSQHNLTDYWGGNPDAGNLADALELGIPEAAECCIQKTDVDGVDILPGANRLMALDLSCVAQERVKTSVLRKLLEAFRREDRYDYVLIDCPPAFNAAGTAALYAADDVIIPIKIDAYAITGMGNVLEQIYGMQRINPQLNVCGILPTMYYYCEDSVNALKAMKFEGFRVLKPIRYSRKVDSATFSRQTLSTGHTGAEIDYRRMVKMYIGGRRNV